MSFWSSRSFLAGSSIFSRFVRSFIALVADMRLVTTDAIVLRTYNLAESDRIVVSSRGPPVLFMAWRRAPHEKSVQLSLRITG